MSTASQNGICSIRLVIFESPHTFVHCNELNQIKSNQIVHISCGIGTWHMVAVLSAGVVVNIELDSRFWVWVRRCCRIEKSDNIYFHSFSKYATSRLPPPIYYYFPLQLGVLVFQSIFLMNYKCRLSNCFQSFISLSNSFGCQLLCLEHLSCNIDLSVCFDGNRQCSRRCQSTLSPVTIRWLYLRTVFTIADCDEREEWLWVWVCVCVGVLRASSVLAYL